MNCNRKCHCILQSSSGLIENRWTNVYSILDRVERCQKELGITANGGIVYSLGPALPLPLVGFSPSFLIKMHEKRGSFCTFLLRIAEKEG